MGLFNTGLGCDGGNGSFGCVVNLIVILIILQFICSIFSTNSGDGCGCGYDSCNGYNNGGSCNCGCNTGC